MRRTRGWITAATVAVTAAAMGAAPASAAVRAGTQGLDRADVKITGDRPGAAVGTDVTVVGDLDGDGFDDLLVPAPGNGLHQPGDPIVGVVHVLYGGPDRLSGTAGLSEVSDAHVLGEHLSDFFGFWTTVPGDLDGDGRDDVAIGASSFGGTFPAGIGKVYLAYGDGKRLDGTVDVTDIADAAFVGEHPSSFAGWVEPAGDLYGDGADELLVGAQGWGGTTGAAYLLYGGERRSGTNSLALAADARITGEQPADIASTGLAGAGDLDGDGLDDIAIGAPSLSGQPGSAHVFYGDDERLAGLLSVTDADATIEGEAEGDGLGRGLAIADDLDRDGVADLVIGAPGNDAGGEDAGAIYIVPGGNRLAATATADDLAVLTLIGEEPGDTVSGLGWGIDGTGDLNGDGRADLLVGATGHDAGGEDAGAVYGIFGIAPGGKPAAGFHYEATGCVEPVAGFRIDPATADRFVPEPFEVHVDELGNAVLGVPAIECDQIAIDGQDAGRALLSDVGIRIESPDGSPGQHFYQLWQPTTNETLHARMRSLGMDTALVPDATFHVDEPLPGVTTATADIPWERVPYEVEAQTPRPVPLPPGGNTWWHRGPRRIIRIAYTFHDRELAFGTASVSTEGGSPLAELLGASERTADEGALVPIHHYEGTIELLDGAGPDTAGVRHPSADAGAQLQVAHSGGGREVDLPATGSGVAP